MKKSLVILLSVIFLLYNNKLHSVTIYCYNLDELTMKIDSCIHAKSLHIFFPDCNVIRENCFSPSTLPINIGKMDSLQSLGIHGAHNLVGISNLDSLPSLSKLDLSSSTRIDFNEVDKLDQLDSLILIDCQLENDDLHSISKMQNLSYISLEWNPFLDSKEISLLRLNMPNCRIIW